MEKLEDRSLARRSFLKRALVVAWSTPVIMTIASEHALAQTTACGTGNPCANSPACPPSKRFCCRTGTTGATCGCFASTAGQTRCNPAS